MRLMHSENYHINSHIEEFRGEKQKEEFTPSRAEEIAIEKAFGGIENFKYYCLGKFNRQETISREGIYISTITALGVDEDLAYERLGSARLAYRKQAHLI